MYEIISCETGDVLGRTDDLQRALDCIDKSAAIGFEFAIVSPE